MDKTAIEKIIELAEPNIKVQGGYAYTDKELMLIKYPAVDRIVFKTLTSLVTTLTTEIGEYVSPILVHVVSPTEVKVMCGINKQDRMREYPYMAVAETPEFFFGRWYDYEELMIALKSKFVETPNLGEVVKLLGTITEENNMTIADDGFTQTVTVRKGVVLKEGRTVNPRVTLVPYSTFVEVKQPERDFLLRLNGDGKAALFEADGGEWKIRARHEIARVLRGMLSEHTEIIVVE